MKLPRERMRGAAPWALLGVLLLAALWLRVAGHNWDRDQHLNVDDYYVTKVTLRGVQLPPGTDLATLADPRSSPLNPHLDRGYVYGALPLYIVKATTLALSFATGDPYFTGLDGTLQTGRVLSGIFDTLTVLLVFAVGAKLWGVWRALVPAALYAFAVLPIQLGHFYICEPFMSTFMAATLLCSILFYRTGRFPYLLLAGACVGLALACKLSAFPALVLPFAATLARYGTTKDEGRRTKDERRRTKDEVTFHVSRFTLHESVMRLMGANALIAAGSLLGFFMGDPYAVLDAPSYLARMAEQAATQNGAEDLWFTRKYVGTLPVVYPWQQLVLLGVGPLVGLLGTLGVGVSIVQAWRKRSWAEGLLLVGAGAYFASIALWEIKWVRYLIPMAPYLCFFATSALFWILSSGFWKQRVAVLKPALIGVTVGSAALGALAVVTIYRTEHTQIAASRWIYSNAPPGSRIGIEKTAIEMPLYLPGHKEQRKEYVFVEMDTMADMTSEEAATTLRAQLEGIDYLILDTAQAASTVPRLPWRYPVQIRYYNLLFSGQLGFSTALAATSYPRLGPLQFPDNGGWIDDSFMDSTHPPIYVFKKERTLSHEEWSNLFADAIQQPSVASRQKP